MNDQNIANNYLLEEWFYYLRFLSEVSDVPASSELLADIGWVEYIDLDRWVIEDLNDYRSLTHSLI
jgi:hypothetical protein